MPEPDDMNRTRSNATALYAFLKEFTELRTKTVRSVEQYEQVLWFSDIPREPECDCAAWHRGEDGESAEVWVAVHQPRLVAPPEPSAKLEPWLDRTQVSDSAVEMPTLRGEITMRIQDHAGEQRLERRFLADWPEVKPLWEQYIEAQWWPWAEFDRRAQLVQRIYTQLFSVYQKQQRLGEQFEVVLGLGFLAWRTPDGQEVRRHLVAASASVSFDAARGIIVVGPAGEGAKPRIEQEMLDPGVRPDPEGLRALENQLAEVSDRLWEVAPVDSVLEGWVRSASPRGVYDSRLTPPDRLLDDPQIYLAPALILRKRTERSFLRAFDEIVTQLTDGAPVPPGVGRFVEIADDPPLDSEEGGFPAEGTSSEVYFPLEANEEQREIVARLATHQGVLVQGPPGTGKSHTIVNLICHLLASGQRVLITSHSSRALRVLQRFIRDRIPEISPLAVVLLGDDRDALQAMEDSVQGITGRQNYWDPKASENRVRSLETELDQARRDEARVLSELRAIREEEVYVHPRLFGQYQGTLQAIAAQLRREADGFGWLKDRPAEDLESPFSSEQFGHLLSLLRDTKADVWQSTGRNALDSGTLPKPDEIAALVDREAKAQAASEGVVGARSRSEYAPLAATSVENRNQLVAELSALLNVISQVSQHIHEWPRQAAMEILGDHDRAWRDLWEVTQDHLASIGSRVRWADETPVSGLGERDHNEVKADAELMLVHLDAGHGWGFGPFRSAAAKRAQYLRCDVKMEGRACEEPDDLRSLVSWLDVERRLGFLRERWAPVHNVLADSAFSSQARDFEDLCEPLGVALGLHDRKAEVGALIRVVQGLSGPAWHDLESLLRLRDCGVAVDLEIRLREAEAELSKARELLVVQANHPDADPAGRELLLALVARDVQRYTEVFAGVCENERKALLVAQRESLLSRLRETAPELSQELATTVADETWDRRAPQFAAAWNWARAVAWLERLTAPGAAQQMHLQLDAARELIREDLGQIATMKAWAHCFARMTEHERQHLVAWSLAVRSIGKGTGKYASMHRRNAREHMNECRSAIPAWVMPMYRVAETITPGADQFDVVIVDEASQSGPEALLLAYLAKRLVVVGDDKQISPTYAGVDFEDVNQLRARHLDGVPMADAYGVHQSFFDLAGIRYKGRIRLREHFRCMPEIIQFSNTTILLAQEAVN